MAAKQEKYISYYNMIAWYIQTKRNNPVAEYSFQQNSKFFQDGSNGLTDVPWQELFRGRWALTWWIGFDIRYPWPGIRNATVKSKTPPAYICCLSFDSNIYKSACQIGMQMLESDR